MNFLFLFHALFNDPCECPNNPNSSNINLLSLKILLPFKRFITELRIIQEKLTHKPLKIIELEREYKFLKAAPNDSHWSTLIYITEGKLKTTEILRHCMPNKREKRQKLLPKNLFFSTTIHTVSIDGHKLDIRNGKAENIDRLQ